MPDEVDSALPDRSETPQEDTAAGDLPIDAGEIVEEVEVVETLPEGTQAEVGSETDAAASGEVSASEAAEAGSAPAGLDSAVEPEPGDSGSVPPGVPMRPMTDHTGDDVTENDRLMAMLAYFLWFIGPAVILLTAEMKARPFQRYHAVQALGVAAVLSAVSFVLVVLGLVLCCVWGLLLIPLGVTVYCMLEAYGGKYFAIPILTNLMISEGWLKELS